MFKSLFNIFIYRYSNLEFFYFKNGTNIYLIKLTYYLLISSTSIDISNEILVILKCISKNQISLKFIINLIAKPGNFDAN